MESSSTITNRLNELKKLILEAKRFLNSDNNKTLEYARKALTEAIELQEPTAIVEAYTLIGQGQMLCGEHTAADISIESALKIAEKHRLSFQEKTLRVYVAVLHQFKGELDIAKELLLKELDGANHQFLPTIYNNLGIISGEKKDYKDSLSWFTKAREMREKEGRMDYAAGLMTNQSEMLLHQGQIQEARELLFEALDIMESPQYENSLGKMFVFRDLGNIHFSEGEMQEAIDNYRLALTICEEHNFTQFYSDILSRTAKANQQIGDDTETEKLYIKALDTKNKNERYDVLKSLIDFHKKKGQVEQAFKYQNDLLTLNEEISKRNKESALDALRTRFEVEEKQKEIERLRYENKINKQLLENSEQIKNQNEELRQFSYAISHDLRAPLRSIKGFAQILNEPLGVQTDKEQQKYIKHILNGVSRLETLIQDLYAFTALNKTTDTVETDLNLCVDAALQNLSSVIRETEAEIKLEKLPTIKAVPSRLEQVFQNIIQNSIKYQREGVPPKIFISVETRPHTYRIKIKDNGRGIESGYHDKAFQLFSRFQAEETSGTGLGLAICQKVIQQLKGKIWLESVTGEGTEVIIELPA